MLTNTTIALAAAAIFGAASAAQAASKDDGERGGFRIGPLGQFMGAPYAWRGRPSSPYAYVPRSRLNQIWYYENENFIGY